MRNVFDQYRHTENRLTHAFFTAMDRDRTLLADFLKVFLKVSSRKASELLLSVQTIPGKPEEPVEQTESEKRGIPDAWIYDDNGWCVVVEVKINAPLTADQIARHVRIARKLGFTKITAVAITANSVPATIADDVIALAWTQVYKWLKGHPDSSWAREAAGYFEALEARMIDNDNLSSGTLTAFSGFPFKSPGEYSYLEARRVIRLAMQGLRDDKRLITLGMDPCIPGRGAITGRDSTFVWDYLSLRTAKDAAQHTGHPHLTLGLSEVVDVMVTIPNLINREFSRAIIQLGEDGFHSLVATVLKNLEATVLSAEPFASPAMRAIQRRYPSQRSEPFIDSLLDFDLRTAFAGKDPVKHQPQWLRSIYAAFASKRSNLQIQIGAKFEVSRCATMRSENALDLIARTWLACKPLIDYELG